MEKYLTVDGETATEKVIEKSRFLTYSSHVESDEEAKAFLSKINAMHPLATHVCYAYVADRSGNLMRFSDNGEPQGTAGMPILEVIKNKKLFETAVAVVRYFGGIKLGAGGLVRAYSGGAAENLDAAAIKVRQMACELALCVGYPEVTPLLRFLEGSGAEQLGSDYADRVTFTVVVKREEEQKFTSALVDCMAGRVLVKKKEEYFYSFAE